MPSTHRLPSRNPERPIPQAKATSTGAHIDPSKTERVPSAFPPFQLYAMKKAESSGRSAFFATDMPRAPATSRSADRQAAFHLLLQLAHLALHRAQLRLCSRLLRLQRVRLVAALLLLVSDERLLLASDGQICL